MSLELSHLENSNASSSPVLSQVFNRLQYYPEEAVPPSLPRRSSSSMSVAFLWPEETTPLLAPVSPVTEASLSPPRTTSSLTTCPTQDNVLDDDSNTWPLNSIRSDACDSVGTILGLTEFPEPPPGFRHPPLESSPSCSPVISAPEQFNDQSSKVTDSSVVNSNTTVCPSNKGPSGVTVGGQERGRRNTKHRKVSQHRHRHRRRRRATSTTS